GDQLGGEGDVLTGGLAGDGVVQAVDQVTGADAVGQALGGGVLDGLAVDGGRQIQGDGVALGGGALDGGDRGEPLTQRLDLLVDVGIGDLEGVDLDRHGRDVR